jgi:acyl-coenzyme A thioesterase PaaI-like protein
VSQSEKDEKAATPRTHLSIDPELVGVVSRLAPGKAAVTLTPTARMAADERGLVHGGFPFGLADYAAMLAVNDPLVVLASAEVRFLKPVVVGDALVATAEVERIEGKRRFVKARVARGDEVVLEADFVCAVPSRHVLDPR